MGRPTKYNERVVTMLCRAIATGSPDSTACVYAGIGDETFYRWQRDNESFAARIKKAEAAWENWHIQNIRRHAKKTFIASAWLLERSPKTRDRWRPPTTRNELSGPGGGALQVQAIPIRGLSRDDAMSAREIGAKVQQKSLPKPKET